MKKEIKEAEIIKMKRYGRTYTGVITIMSKGVAEMRRLCFDVEKVTLFCYNYKNHPG